MTIAFWCVLAAGLMPQIFGLYAKASRGFDNNNPRDYLANLHGKKARASAAMANGYEGFPLFAAAVIISNLLNTDQYTVDLLSIGYIASRVFHGVFYILGYGTMRSLVWTGGLACIIAIFFVSA